MNVKGLEKNILDHLNIEVDGTIIEDYIREYIEENRDTNTVRYIIPDTLFLDEDETEEAYISYTVLVDFKFYEDDEEELESFSFEVLEIEY